MAFDPIQEDCLRLIIEDMRRKKIFPLEDAAAIERGMELYREDPARLINTDRDRSFHLMVRAAELLDYRIPFLMDETKLEQMEDDAEDYLREAVELDPGNWDAQRMLAAVEAESGTEYVTYLVENAPAVEESLARFTEAAANPYDQELASSLAQHPYLRWLAAIASQALISGQYRMSVEYAEKCLALAPHDPGDVRYTAVLALSKLEATRDELRAFRARHASSFAMSTPEGRRLRPGFRRALDPWSLLAELNAAYRAFDFNTATKVLRTLLNSCPHAAQSLYLQAELPEGIYARVNVAAGSDDELVIAISEATPLLQEGPGSPDAGGLSCWISGHELLRPVAESMPMTDAPGGGAHGRGGAR